MRAPTAEAIPALPEETRVLLLAPAGKDAPLIVALLDRAGMASVACADLEALITEMNRGAAVLLLAEEIVTSDVQHSLVAWLGEQSPWSDLPVLILARPGADSATVAIAMDVLGNVTVLERPMRLAALVSAVRTAVRARERQYQIRGYLAEQDQAAADLRDAAARKDEFLAILAHELRNPLAPIRNSLHILRLTAAVDPTIGPLAGMMERQVNQMVRLVDDLLEVSRITRGTIELRTEPVEMECVLLNAIETSQPVIDGGNHTLRVSLPDEPVTLYADPIRLAQVFSNLLNNAAKYTPPGGEITLSARATNDLISVAISDNGTGIPQEMLPRVFELFTQVERGSTATQGGLGIGLTLVRSLVEIHGGHVEATSGGIGRGSVFTVTLPRTDGAPLVHHGSAPLDPQTLHGQRVLVVDDNRDAADSLSDLLRLLGADVQTTYSGKSALELAAAFRPSSVILDIGMPGMDGHETARHLRQGPGGDSLTLIALTGWGQPSDVDQSRIAGFNHHLTKPASLETLKAMLRAVVPAVNAYNPTVV